MKHRAPATFKPTDLHWQPRAPGDWELKPLCRVVSVNDDVLPAKFPFDTEISYVDISSVSYGKGIVSAESMLFANAPSRARRLAHQGDVIISTVRTYLKSIAEVDKKHSTCVFSTGFAVLRVRPGKLKDGFLKWMTSNELLIQAIEAHSTGVSYPAISAHDLAKLKVAVPPLDEQRRIAALLERETARIDALIKQKTHFIELLKEKRQALITQAITKGLESNVPMKDSGVEWLGEVPAHWIPIKFRHVARVTEGLVDPKAEKYRTLPLIAPNHIESNTGRLLGLETAEEQNAESGKYTCKPGDIIYSKIRPALAKVTIAPCACLCSADMYPLQAAKQISAARLYYLLLSGPFTAWATLESMRVAMPKINREALGELRICLPPLVEQERAAEWIDDALPKIDAVIANTEMSIGLLNERRSALITAAVTGQIDLRENAA